MVSGFSGIFGPQNSEVKQKIQTGVSQKLAGFEPPDPLEIHSALFEMRFFKKGAISISSKNQSAKGVNLSANRLNGWRLFCYENLPPEGRNNPARLDGRLIDRIG